MALNRRIVGTAGHIDHGKTALIRALTGVDTDRLPEEKRRGITIDLGFAHLALDDVQMGFVDVPGHERFVRNMHAGVGGIDAALLVVAADESIEPQTREHFDICRLLRIPTGVVAITKTDLVEPEIVELVRLEVEEMVRDSFLAGRPIVATSAATGAGIAELRGALGSVLAAAPARDAEGRVFRLPIDRAFTMRGFGSVVTGTTISGAVGEGDELEILPAGTRTRARNIQVHGAPRQRAEAGERTSINLADVPVDALARGQQLAAPAALRPSTLLTADLELLAGAPPLRNETRVRLHLHAAEVMAKVRIVAGADREIVPGGRAAVQFHLETPAVALAGDRFVIRRYSPPRTIGGGAILDPLLRKLKGGQAADVVATLRSAELAPRVAVLARLAGASGISIADLRARTGITATRLDAELESPPEDCVAIGRGASRRFVHANVLRRVRTAAMEVLQEFFRANRTALGMPKSAFLQKVHLEGSDPELVQFALGELERESIASVTGDLVDVPGRSQGLAGAEGELARAIEDRFREAGLAPPPVSELIRSIPQRPKTIEGVVGYLARSGVLVRLAENVYLHREVLAEARRRAAAHRGQMVDVAFFKDLYGISRKVVIPLLEHFDRAGVTRRIGDHREIVGREE